MIDERPAKAGSLQLSAGYFRDAVVCRFHDPQSPHQHLRFFPHFLPVLEPGVIGRKQDVVQDTEFSHHIHLLKDKSHTEQPEFCHLFVIDLVIVFPEKSDISGRRAVHSADRIEHRRFSASRRSHDRYKLAIVQGKIHITQYIVTDLVDNIGLAQAFYIDDRFHISPP